MANVRKKLQRCSRGHRVGIDGCQNCISLMHNLIYRNPLSGLGQCSKCDAPAMYELGFIINDLIARTVYCPHHLAMAITQPNPNEPVRSGNVVAFECLSYHHGCQNLWALMGVLEHAVKVHCMTKGNYDRIAAARADIMRFVFPEAMPPASVTESKPMHVGGASGFTTEVKRGGDTPAAKTEEFESGFQAAIDLVAKEAQHLFMLYDTPEAAIQTRMIWELLRNVKSNRTRGVAKP